MSSISVVEFIRDKSWRCASVAHRGAWGPAPENSIGAMEAAVEQQCNFVEIDVRESLDGTQFCFHDGTLERMTGTSGPIGPHPWSYLSELSLYKGDGSIDSEASTHKIPSFEDMLKTNNGVVYLDVDLKVPRQMERAAKTINACNMTSIANLKLDVYSNADLADLLALEQHTGILVKPVFRVCTDNVSSICDLVKQHQFAIVEALFDTWETLEIFSAAAINAGTDVFVNTIDVMPSCQPLNDSLAKTDPEGVWGRLIDSGIRHIQTDLTEQLHHYLKRERLLVNS